MKKSQNDLRQVVALLNSVPYKRSDDQKNTTPIQMPHADGSLFCAGDELTTLGFAGRCCAYGQSRAFRCLRSPGWIGPNRLAQIMGRIYLLRPSDIWDWNRNRTAQHEFRPDGVDCRCSRQSNRDGFTTFTFPFYLDTTLTLKRSYLCAA